MLLAHEWNEYGQRRKSLRVTNPTGKQRGSYFLSLPLRIGIPLSVTWTLLHWLCSQSIFLAVVGSYEGSNFLEIWFQVGPCGFSPMAILFTLLAGICVVLGVAVLANRPLSLAAPMAGSCSVAIAAACHGSEPDASTKPLQWGVPLGDDQDGSGPGHCCFSSGEVSEPIAGKVYA